MVDLLSPVGEKTEGHLKQIDTLHQYLKANVEFLDSEKTPAMPDEPQFTRVKITVTNSAPVDSLPKIVFVGIGLSIARIGGDSMSVNARTINFKIHRLDSPTAENDNLRFLQQTNYIRMNGMEFPGITPDEQENGEVLLPGESIFFDMDIPNQDLPYYQFRLDGTVSYRHLYHHETFLPVAEAFTKPIISKALRDFNSLDIHRVLKSILLTMPEFDNDTKLSEIRRYIGVLTTEDDNITMMQKTVNELYRQHKFPTFQAHMQQVYDYFEHIKEATNNLREAISSSMPERIIEEVDKLQALNNEVEQINRETESIMSSYNFSAEEVGYKYQV